MSFGYEWSHTDDLGVVSIHIELGYARESNSKYADPSKVNWFQTLKTNYMTSSNEGPPPEDTEIRDYVDGCSGEGVCLCDKNTSVFKDTTKRHHLTDRDVYWKAETSVVGRADDGLKILGTVEWGFQIDRKGKPHYMQLRKVKTPSPFHLSKFQELT